MGVQIDDARGHDLAAGIDQPFGIIGGNVAAQFDDLAALDADIPAEARCLQTIDNRAALDDDIILEHAASPI